MSPLSQMNHCARSVHRGAILVCLGLILVYPLVSVPVQASVHNLVPRIGEIAARVVTEGAIWLYAAIVLAVAFFGERRTLASIGLRRFRFASLGFAVAGAVAMAGAGALAAYLVYGLLHRAEHAEAQAAALVHGSVAYALCLAVRAGVVEEILFRGLAIEQLTVLTGSRWVSAFLATTVFIVIHALHFDWIQLVPIAAVSVVLVGLYLWRRDLWANILAHILVDGVGLVALALQAHKAAH
ncbi:MAG: CPBP family intramembrane glutamic endopeptidase [Chthoniobacterales bacterium]